MTTFRQLLDQFEESARTRQAKGRRFELFCEEYFRTDPFWTERFDEVWAWMDWPGRGERPDTGIDLVARECGSGDLVAIQCKFYSPDATLSWDHLSTFVAMLGQPEFSAGLVVTTAGTESSNVHRNIDNNAKPVKFWRVEDFEDSRVDWDEFEIERPNVLALRDLKQLRPHQESAIADVVTGFEEHKRGQLVMACGTGKTFTSLRLAEQLVGAGGKVLFLVPSINLLNQSVKAWASDAAIPLTTFAVCSDTHAGKRNRDEDMSPNDLVVAASTNAGALAEEIAARTVPTSMTVVFSTYQSIDVITEAQGLGIGEFDLVVCDEAHRTTGAFKEITEQSAFTKVHQNEYVAAQRRLYMTATPRVYGDQTKSKAAESDVIVASMDDESTFGPVFHELRFGEAVAQELLTDYKVIVLAVNEDAVSAAFQRQLASDGNELALDDIARIIGCWHGLSKRGPQFEGDNTPMRRAVAFSSTIKASKAFTARFPELVNSALEDRRDSNAVKVETDHVDGTTNVKVRSEAIAWLEEPPGQRVCRVLSNAKCLTEGVDVPALDAVLFLNPRKSVVDVVQAVGRVMRRSEGKEFGYVILPIGIPAGVPPHEALRDNERYQVVWQVLQALRSHDERLAAEINKIDINKASSKVNVIGIGLKGGDEVDDPGSVVTIEQAVEAGELSLPDLGEWRDALYARVVEKVGDRRYMEHWAADISAIASAQETRIRTLLDHPEQNPHAVERFDEFLEALQNNLNDAVTRDDAIGMLSQHLITRPVFEALFGGDDFTRKNPVSQVMQAMIDTLDDANLPTETATLEGFYHHIEMLIGGIDTAEGRQRVITELYEKFFKKALPKTSESLGIVYTPVEIVDFINRSVNDLLGMHFGGTSLSDEGVHVLDPFTGTGTFIARLIQSGLITPDDLARKYSAELHANEIMLLAYYIAAINIETAYRGTDADRGYTPFDGIVLTDTFQMTEEGDPLDFHFFPHNNARAEHQKALDIQVIVGNPPYSVGQTSESDNNQNMRYPSLDTSIRTTYAAASTGNPRSLYDSYVRAIRWASNRVSASPDGGIIGFVTNGGWLDGNTADGLRSTLQDEFDHIYIYNLRGNARAGGEQRRAEADNVFGSGSRATVAITFLVKQPGTSDGGAAIHYLDIGEYLTRADKLAHVAEATIDNLGWIQIQPNHQHDWINQRDDRYDQLMSLTGDSDALFSTVSSGVKTNRDAWMYNSSRSDLVANVTRFVEYYNAETDRFTAEHPRGGTTASASSELARAFVDRDDRSISWCNEDFRQVASGQHYELNDGMIRDAQYRPFFRQHLAFDRNLNGNQYRTRELFPEAEADNIAISVPGRGCTSPFAALATDRVPDLVLAGDKGCQVYARWQYPRDQDAANTLLDYTSTSKVSNLNRRAVGRFQSVLGTDLNDDDVFYYVYGVLHSIEYRKAFEANLKKEPPRVPLLTGRDHFDAFSVAGRELCDLHVGYETVDPYPLEEEWVGGADPAADPSILLVGSRKMSYPKISDPRGDTSKKIADKTRLRYNDYLTLTGIPDAAHDYVLGNRSGIDWIIDRYYIKTDKASGIVNDPNQWGLEHDDPRYIIDLIKRVVTVSVRTVDIVNSLPELTF